MKNILKINSSLFATESVSKQLMEELVAQLAHDHDPIVQRDLSQDGVPHVDGEWFAALTAAEEQRSESQAKQVAYSDQLIAEVQAADILVIAAPMYNFSVPSVLKAWFDHIARAGVTFSYTADGPKGLLTGKTAYIVTTRGGIHKDQPSDTQVPFIENFLAFIGIDDVRVIYAEGLNMGEDAREKGLAAARQRIAQLAA